MDKVSRRRPAVVPRPGRMVGAERGALERASDPGVEHVAEVIGRVLEQLGGEAPAVGEAVSTLEILRMIATDTANTEVKLADARLANVTLREALTRAIAERDLERQQVADRDKVLGTAVSNFCREACPYNRLKRERGAEALPNPEDCDFASPCLGRAIWKVLRGEIERAQDDMERGGQ